MRLRRRPKGCRKIILCALCTKALCVGEADVASQRTYNMTSEHMTLAGGAGGGEARGTRYSRLMMLPQSWLLGRNLMRSMTQLKSATHGMFIIAGAIIFAQA